MKFNYYAKLYLNFGKTQWKKSTFIKNSSISRFGEDSPKTKQSKRVIPIIDKLASDLILFINYKNTYLFQTVNYLDENMENFNRGINLY